MDGSGSLKDTKFDTTTVFSQRQGHLLKLTSNMTFFIVICDTIILLIVPSTVGFLKFSIS